MQLIVTNPSQQKSFNPCIRWCWSNKVWGKVFWGIKWLGLFAPKILHKFPLVFMDFFPGIQSMCVICPAQKEEKRQPQK